jgi:alpha-1,3/alpha-1,6-mannosyltransferase
VQALLYTPASEHLGIVPLEAMAAGLPVLACDSGGPLETVDDPTTGRLRPPDAATWAAALEEMLAWSDEERYNVGVAGIERVRDRFSVVGMTEAIERAVLDARAMDAVRPVWKEDSSLLALVMATLSLTFIAVGLVVL